MTTDTRTVNRDYKLPYPSNTLGTDVARLREALESIDLDVDTLFDGLATKLTQAQTEALITTAIDGLKAGAPGALDTLSELAAALDNDADFAATVTNLLAEKASITYVDNALGGGSNRKLAPFRLSNSFGTGLSTRGWLNFTDDPTLVKSCPVMLGGEIGPYPFAKPICGDGEYSSVMLTADWRIVAAGRQNYAIGLGANDFYQSQFSTTLISDPLVEDDFFIQVFRAGECAYALTAKGYVYATGYNGYGQLGMGDYDTRYTWRRIPTLGPDNSADDLPKRIVAMACSANAEFAYTNYGHAFFLDSSGRLWATGYNNYGQLGVGDTSTRSTPARVGTLENVDMLSTAGIESAHVLARTTDGKVWAWGYNGAGALGAGGYSSSSVPLEVGSNARQILTAGGNRRWSYGSYDYFPYSRSYYINNLGYLYFAGSNEDYYGVSGLDNNEEYHDTFTRIGVGDDLTFSTVATTREGYFGNSWAIGGTPGAPNGTIYGWGSNESYQLGVGNSNVIDVPTQLSAVDHLNQSFPRTAIKAIYPYGQGFDDYNYNSIQGCLFVAEDGQVWATGTNGFYSNPIDGGSHSLPVPWAGPASYNDGNELVCIAAGSSSQDIAFWAAAEDGSYWAAGYNASGMLGYSPTNYTMPSFQRINL